MLVQWPRDYEKEKLVNVMRKIVNRKQSKGILERVRRYEIVKDYLADMSKCLTCTSESTPRLMLGDQIDLTNIIGTPSKFGIVHVSKGSKGFARLLKMASKITSAVKRNDAKLDSNLHEISVLSSLSADVLSGNFPNFPLMYGVEQCEAGLEEQDILRCFKTNTDIVKIKDILRQPYYIMFNELADGDLKTWLGTKIYTEEYYLSAISQILFSLVRLNKCGYEHKDAHWGNFLYHEVSSGGYWWYSCNGHNYYVKNTGQLWVAWDFSSTRRIANVNALPIEQMMTRDTRRILHAFINKQQNGWMSDEHQFPDVLSNIVTNILKMTTKKSTCDFHTLMKIMESSALVIDPPVESKLTILNKEPFKLDAPLSNV